MRRFVDLHTHSNASDGQLPPAALVALAETSLLAAVALTDHDTTAGLPAAREAASALPDLRFISGVEFSADLADRTLHILGLGIDESSPHLQALAARLRSARDERNPKIIAKLRALGVEITLEDALAVAVDQRMPQTPSVARGGPRGGRGAEVLGRPHIAEALRRKGIVPSTRDAFEQYVGEGGAAYVRRRRPSPRAAISAIRSAGGTAVLAHPAQLNCEDGTELERVLCDLIHDGLNGIEVYHSGHTAEQTRLYMALAHEYQLAVSGGSDFHGSSKPETRLGHPRVPASAVTGELAKLLGQGM